jgi:hypothetical protein
VSEAAVALAGVEADVLVVEGSDSMIDSVPAGMLSAV